MSVEVAILLFDGFTALDAVGPYEVLSRLPGARTTFVAARPGPQRTDIGSLTIVAERSLEELPRPDVLLVPGGPGQEGIMDDGPVHDWLRAAHETTTWTTSVCTGSLVLAAAGLLGGRRATSHWLALDRLASFGAQPVSERVVLDGKIVTAAGVSAGIDMALTLAACIAGEEEAERIQLLIEYDPQPPFPAGSPLLAPAALVDRARAASRHTQARTA